MQSLEARTQHGWLTYKIENIFSGPTEAVSATIWADYHDQGKFMGTCWSSPKPSAGALPYISLSMHYETPAGAGSALSAIAKRRAQTTFCWTLYSEASAQQLLTELRVVVAKLEAECAKCWPESQEVVR